MSGGSFNYAYRSEPGDYDWRPCSYREMADWCAEMGQHAAAAAMRAMAERTEKALAELRREHDRLRPLMYAIEWWRSGDYGQEEVERALSKI